MADIRKSQVEVIDNKADDAYSTAADINGTGYPSSTASSETELHPDGGTFAAGGQTRYYKPCDEYEGLHRWDPQAEWTEQEEKRVVRRLDWKICTWACFMFFALQLDRGNIVQALTDNMLKDLRLTTNQYNYGQTIFYLSFLVAELPSQMISKRLGPDNWIPIQMVSWSIVACCQSRLTGAASFYVTRSLLGLIEGGFIPDVILYLSYFYKSNELPTRLSFFWASYMSTSIVSAFLAYGILHLRALTGWAGWRWLFALEGALTACIGIASYFYLPPSPTQTASRFRGKDGWFSAREEVIMVNRILRDDPSKGDMHNRQGLTLSLLWEALRDYDLWPIYWLGLSWNLAYTPVSNYLTLIIKGLGFDTFQTNLLSIPAYCLFIAQAIFWTWFSEKTNNRFLAVLVCQLWMFPVVLALVLIPNGASAWVRYALTVLQYGYPYIHPILVALTSRNAGSVRTRTVGSALYNMAVQASSVVASNVYQARDAPHYRLGNKALLGVIGYNVLLIAAIKLYYMRRNAWKEARWSAMSQPEKQAYLSHTRDQGSKRLDFRFAH